MSSGRHLLILLVPEMVDVRFQPHRYRHRARPVLNVGRQRPGRTGHDREMLVNPTPASFPVNH